jgi:ABC-2 type transport system permease protein
MAFALALPATNSLHEVTREETDYEALVDGVVEGERPSLENLPTRTVTEMREDVRPEKVWWLLAPNPFVILADAAPQKQRAFEVRFDGNGEDEGASIDPLGAIAGAVRDARDPNSSLDDGLLDGRKANSSPVWPWGLAFNALLGIGAVAITIRRLRTPSKKLAKGVRVA